MDNVRIHQTKCFKKEMFHFHENSPESKSTDMEKNGGGIKLGGAWVVGV